MDFRIGYRRPLRTASLLRKKRQRTRLWLSALAVVALTAVACKWSPAPAVDTSGALAAPLVQVALKTSAAAPAPAARRIYPYSIVPGGVASQADLARRVTADQVVARHYASFDIGKAHVVTNAKARAVHVSYRKGDKVYWTANKVMLAQGETLLSDGTSEIRGRCGNRISETAQLPVAMGEPTAAELDESMNVAPDPAAEGGLQNASFLLGEDGMPSGNPNAYTRFPTFAQNDAPPANPLTRTGMPPMPSTSNGMGLEPTRYLTVAADPTIALPPTTEGSTAVTPDVPVGTDPATPLTPSTPATPDTPFTPATPDVPVIPVTPIVPVVPADPVTPFIPATPDSGTTPATPDAPAAPVTPGAPDTPVTPATPGTPVPPVKTPLPAADIPEPGTLWLIGAALVLLVFRTRKNERAALRTTN